MTAQSNCLCFLIEYVAATDGKHPMVPKRNFFQPSVASNVSSSDSVQKSPNSHNISDDFNDSHRDEGTIVIDISAYSGKKPSNIHI